MDIFLLNAFKQPLYFFSVALIVIFSVCVHEFCHAFVALKNGDPTAANHGHLTLNPLKQMGVISLIMFALIGICWGAVPVDMRRLDTRKKRVAVALAGPMANLVLFVLAVVLAVVLREQRAVGKFFALAAMFNMVLFILNMLPVPGLDGGNAAAALLPAIHWRDSELAKGLMFGLVVLVFAFAHTIFTAAIYATAWTINLLASVSGV